MYTETEFMDMSLASRLVKLEHEMGRLAEWMLKVNYVCIQTLFKTYIS